MSDPTHLKFHGYSDDNINVFDGEKWLPEIGDGEANFEIKVDLGGGPMIPTHLYLTGKLHYDDGGWTFELGVPSGTTVRRTDEEDDE